MAATSTMRKMLLALAGPTVAGIAVGAAVGAAMNAVFAGLWTGFGLGLAVGFGLLVMIGRGRPGRCATQRGEWEQQERNGAKD